MKTGWTVHTSMKVVAVVPDADSHEHLVESMTCACQPRVDEPTGYPWKPLIVHNSFDGREHYEPEGWVPAERVH